MKKFITFLMMAFCMPNYAKSAAVEALATDDATPSHACITRKIEEARRELNAIKTAVRSMGLSDKVDPRNFSAQVPGMPIRRLTYRFSGHILDVRVEMIPGFVLVGSRRYRFDPMSGLMTKAIGHEETVFKGFHVFSFLENKIDYIIKARARAAKYSTIIEINGVQFKFIPGVLSVNNTFYSIKGGFVYAKNDPRKRKVKVYNPPLNLEPFIGNMARIYGATEDAIPSIKVWYTNNPRGRFSPGSRYIKDPKTARARGLMLYESKAVASLEDVKRSAVHDVIIEGLKVGKVCYSGDNYPVAINHEGRLLNSETLRRAGIDPSGILTG